MSKKIDVRLVLPNGGVFVMKTKVIPVVGSEITVENQPWGTVESVRCVYDRDQGDYYLVKLGHP